MQRQAANMDPAMMQQAMGMMGGMTPDQLRAAGAQARAMPPEALAAQGADAAARVSAQARYQLDATAALKAEGNKLHAAKQYAAAAAKYERGAANLEAHATREAVALRASCLANIASCYLQLERWADCAAACEAVLAGDAENVKALFRRGQALAALGEHAAAAADLARAAERAPASDRAVIKAKLEAVRAVITAAASAGPVIEEVLEPAAAPAPSAAPAAAEGVDSDADSDSEPPELIEVVEAAAPPRRFAPAVPPPAPAPFAFPPPGAAGAPPDAAAAAEALRRDPGLVRDAARQIESMTEEQLAAVAAAMPGAGAPGAPAMDAASMRMAAKMMAAMGPEELARMTEMAGSLGLGGAGAGLAGAGVAAAAAGSGAGAADAAAPAAPGLFGAPGGGGDAMAALRRQMGDPATLKTMQGMLRGMPPDQLAAMLNAQGMAVTPAQAEVMVNTMGAVSDRQLEWVARAARGYSAAVDGWRRARALAASSAALVAAVLVLLLALFLRWRGWM
jgi:tetratricopeptide (TPR) repeat protein